MTTPPDHVRPILVIDYLDPLEGFSGWFVRHSMNHRMCAGGMRVQSGLTRQHMEAMARNMAMKMQIAGLRVDGAKCGIDYDPTAPGKHAAMARFLAALKPYVECCYSMGPDLNVEMAELDTVAKGIGIASVKMAVAHAQGWDLAYYSERSRTLGQEAVAGWTLGRLRAGQGVAAAALATLEHLGIPAQGATVAVQGFGAVARGTARLLLAAGVRLIAVSDAHKCFLAPPGDPISPTLLAADNGNLLPNTPPPGVSSGERDTLFATPCDLLIPAAVENAITTANAHTIRAKAVVPGANLAVSDAAATILFERGILVVPDFLAGSGGSLSMEGLYGPDDHPSAEEVLAHIDQRMRHMTKEMLALSVEQNIRPVDAARKLCASRIMMPSGRPYGRIA